MSKEKTVTQVGPDLLEVQEALAAEKRKNEELEFENKELKESVENLKKQLAAAEQKKSAGANLQFTMGDDTYEILVKAAHIPGLGKRTAIEIANDEEAQAALVKANSRLIKKIFKEQ